MGKPRWRISTNDNRPGVEPLKLVPGVECESPTLEEKTRRVSVLKATVEKYLPDFTRGCKITNGPIMLHQDSFAAGYHQDEYVLLGMAIKYAGLHGCEVRIMGVNEETC